MNTLLSIVWDASPDLFSIGPLTVRWYGLFWVAAFSLGIFILQKIFKKDNVNIEWVDSVFMYVFIGTVLGARFGHVFFYGWDYYSHNLLDIFKIWEGGLASHGAALGIMVALWLFSKFVSKKSILWIMDRVVIPVIIGGAFIRLGNFFNHEIIGKPTNSSFGIVFTRVDNIARHPAQLYEAASGIVLAIILIFLHFKTEARKKPGLLFGVFMTILFTSRFFTEFIKENQEVFENDMVLNMGQWLSIPFVMVGVFFIIFSLLKPKVE